MTQPQVIETEPEAEAEAVEEQAPSELSLEDEIRERLNDGVEEALKDIPRLTHIDWGEKGAKWAVGTKVPGGSMTVFELHATGSTEERVDFIPYTLGDIRVYTVPPKADLSEAEGAPPDGYRRYTINRSQPSIETETMSRVAFFVELARERNELAAIDDSRVECPNPECEHPCRSTASFCEECGEELPEEEEEETPTPAKKS